MTPAEELRAAAEQLRQDVRNALADSPLPWVVDEDVIRCGTEGSVVVDRSCDLDGNGDMPYIARMHPGVGAALVELLDYAARYADLVDSLAGRPIEEPHPDRHTRHLLAVARTILGTQPAEPRHPYAHLDEDDTPDTEDAGSIDDYEGDQP